MKDYIAISREIKRRGEAKKNARRRHIHHALAACLLLCICLPLGFGVGQLVSPPEIPSEVSPDESVTQPEAEGTFSEESMLLLPEGPAPETPPEFEESEEPTYSEEPEDPDEPIYSEEPEKPIIPEEFPTYSEEPEYSGEWADPEFPTEEEPNEELDPPCEAPAPYFPAEKVVLNPVYQAADVWEEDNPPADVTILPTLRSKLNFFEKYAQSGVFDGKGNQLPLDIEDRYDEAFFEQNALITVYRVESSSSHSLKLKEVVIHTDGTVEVILTRRVPGPGEAGTCALRKWMFFIEIPAEHPVTSANPAKLTVETVS